MNYYSQRKYTLQGENKIYNDGDIIESIVWYDNDNNYDKTRSRRNCKIEFIGENIITIYSEGNVEKLYIWIDDIISIK